GDSFVLLFGGQPLDEAHPAGNALEAALLRLLGDSRPFSAGAFHRYVATQQDVYEHLKLLEARAVAPLDQYRIEELRLASMDFVREKLLLARVHAPYGEDGVAKYRLRDCCHDAIVRRQRPASSSGCATRRHRCKL